MLKQFIMKKNKMKRDTFTFGFLLVLGLILALLPASSAQAQAAIPHSFDDSVLLMFSAQMRLDGEVASAVLPGGRVLALVQQAEVGNELDALINLYADQIAKLRASDDYDPDLEARLVTELEAKVAALQKKAQVLKAQRSQGRRGLFGFIRRGLRSLGRGAGWLLGKTMEGAGKVAEFAIEDVAPQVLKEALQNGAPLNAALVRRVARELLVNRVSDAIAREQRRRAGQLPSTEVEEVDDLLDAFEDDEKAESYEEGTDSGNDLGPVEQEGSQIVSYQFTLADQIGRSAIFHPGDFGYRLMDQTQGGCWEGQQDLDSLSIVLQFDTNRMTVSGTISGQTQEVKYSDPTPFLESSLMLDGSGGFTTSFSDIPAEPYGDNSWKFSGYGTADLNYGGVLGCAYWDSENDEMIYFTVNDQLSSSGISSEVHITVNLDGNGSTLDILSRGEVDHPENLGLYFLVEFETDQPIDLPLP